MTLRSNAFYCKDARGSEEISNLALTVFCGHMRTQEEAKNKKKRRNMVASGSSKMQGRPRQRRDLQSRPY